MATKLCAVGEYIETLDDTTRRQIMEDYDHYEEKTVIGTSALRTHTEALMAQQGIKNHNAIRLWFEMVASATFRYYARKYWQE